MVAQPSSMLAQLSSMSLQKHKALDYVWMEHKALDYVFPET